MTARMIRRPFPQLSSTAIISLFSVYIIWGSTYLAIRYAIETLPPLSMAAARYLLAGLIMFALALFRKEKPLNTKQKKVAAWTGLLMVTANGLVCVAERWVPSGIAAVIIGAMPIWIMLFNWIAFSRIQPQINRLIGAGIGLFGIAQITLGEGSSLGLEHMGKVGILILCSSSWLWVIGTLSQRSIGSIQSPFLFSGLQMFAGSMIVGLLGLGLEQPWLIQYSEVSSQSIYAFFYLVFFGSVLTFTAYSWLARNVEPHVVSSYALVNPVIAIGLGWMFYDEAITSRFLVATLFILLGLVFLLMPIPGKHRGLKFHNS
jgi:drug/metabolite transporter (DMT)-like permease